jgi:hypothetical protein
VSQSSTNQLRSKKLMYDDRLTGAAASMPATSTCTVVAGTCCSGQVWTSLAGCSAALQS